jgi:predicted ester cyclase
LLNPDVTLGVIPTVTALAIRHFKQKKGDEGERLEPKHPAVRFLFAAWNGDDFSGAHEHIAPDVEIFTNGTSYQSEHGGPAMLKESIESWRALMPDLAMELSQEISEKRRVAIEFRVRGTHTGGTPGLPASGGSIDIEASAFLRLEDDKIAEIWTVFDSLALAVQTGTVRAPRSSD